MLFISGGGGRSGGQALLKSREGEQVHKSQSSKQTVTVVEKAKEQRDARLGESAPATLGDTALCRLRPFFSLPASFHLAAGASFPNAAFHFQISFHVPPTAHYPPTEEGAVVLGHQLGALWQLQHVDSAD